MADKHWYEIENDVDDDVLFDLMDLIGQGSNVVLSNVAFHMAGKADSEECSEHRDKLAGSIAALSLGLAWFGRRICGKERFDAQVGQTAKDIQEDYEKQKKASKAARELADFFGIDVDELFNL